MITWKAVEPDIQSASLTSLTSALGFLDVVALSSALMQGPVVLLADTASAMVRDHVSGHRYERGGLLLGKAFVPTGASDLPFPVIFASKALPSVESHGTGVSLRMQSSVWESVRSESGLQVVGWFHSHPNLGAFFSGTDRKTQREFFFHEYSLGLVIDAFRDECAYFVGPESLQIPDRHVFKVGAGSIPRFVRDDRLRTR